mgnify:CR=1 FL=1
MLHLEPHEILFVGDSIQADYLGPKKGRNAKSAFGPQWGCKGRAVYYGLESAVRAISKIKMLSGYVLRFARRVQARKEVGIRLYRQI